MHTAPPGFRGTWRDDLPARAVYSEAAGIHRMVPRAVAVPADADDVALLARWATEHGMPLTPRGSGSSMAGGAVGPGVIVDLGRLNALGGFDARRAVFCIGPGVVCADADAAFRRDGWRFPVDPSSAAFATVGGMTATNAAGARSMRHGAMSEFVAGVECVFADGSRAWVRRGEPARAPALARVAALRDALRAGPVADDDVTPGRPVVRKNSSGYDTAAWLRTGDATRLLVGSEGTLALFTAIEIVPDTIPAATVTTLAAFGSIDHAAAAAAAMAAAGAAACEFLDRSLLDIARRGASLDLPDDTEAVLLVDDEVGDAETAEAVARSTARVLRESHALLVRTATTDAESAALWHVRHAASPVLAALGPQQCSMQVVEDGAVPPGALADYIRGMRALFARHAVSGVVFGHAGDGHVHANVLVDLTTPDWRTRIARVFDDGVELVRSLGGTLAGEHGDGRLRAGALGRIWPPADVDVFTRVKRAFDPDGILNPGVKLPAAGAPVLGAPVKYDPALEPLPDAARRALDRVQRERAWRQPRLALLPDAAGG